MNTFEIIPAPYFFLKKSSFCWVWYIVKYLSLISRYFLLCVKLLKLLPKYCIFFTISWHAFSTFQNSINGLNQHPDDPLYNTTGSNSLICHLWLMPLEYGYITNGILIGPDDLLWLLWHQHNDMLSIMEPSSNFQFITGNGSCKCSSTEVELVKL